MIVNSTMTEDSYLTRLSLREDANIQSLVPLLLGKDPAHSHNHAGHRLVWSVFAGTNDEGRDFLWRQTGYGQFIVLSTRPPNRDHPVLQVDIPKPFTPALTVGQVVQFSLRANPVIRNRDKGEKGDRSVKHDVVMNALRSFPREVRAKRRRDTIKEAGLGWLQRQAQQSGFKVNSKHMQIEGYLQHKIPRPQNKQDITFSSLDFDGYIEVTCPDRLITKIKSGFGSARAFGCGLMLIRRA